MEGSRGTSLAQRNSIREGAQTVQSRYSRTPKEFVFAAKVPYTITHEKMLHKCESEILSS